MEWARVDDPPAIVVTTFALGLDKCPPVSRPVADIWVTGSNRGRPQVTGESMRWSLGHSKSRGQPGAAVKRPSPSWRPGWDKCQGLEEVGRRLPRLPGLGRGTQPPGSAGPGSSVHSPAKAPFPAGLKWKWEADSWDTLPRGRAGPPGGRVAPGRGDGPRLGWLVPWLGLQRHGAGTAGRARGSCPADGFPAKCRRGPG